MAFRWGNQSFFFFQEPNFNNLILGVMLKCLPLNFTSRHNDSKVWKWEQKTIKLYLRFFKLFLCDTTSSLISLQQVQQLIYVDKHPIPWWIVGHGERLKARKGIYTHCQWTPLWAITSLLAVGQYMFACLVSPDSPSSEQILSVDVKHKQN